MNRKKRQKCFILSINIRIDSSIILLFFLNDFLSFRLNRINHVTQCEGTKEFMTLHHRVDIMVHRKDTSFFGSSTPEVFCKKGALRNFAKFTGKHLCQSLFFNEVAGLVKKRLWHRCFPVNFAKFLRTPFLTEHLR